MFLLDTNVVSEWVKTAPNARVVAWLAAVPDTDVFISVATLAELWHGVIAMPQGMRRSTLERWVTQDLAARFEGRILSIDAQIARAWAAAMNDADRAGRPVGIMDAFFAATATTLGLTLVTRNVRDFQALGIPLFNPWEG